MKNVISHELNGVYYIAEPKLFVPFSFEIQQLMMHGNAGSSTFPLGNLTSNSRALYKWAVNNGFKLLETDIRATSDGKLVLCHNESINDAAVNTDGTAISSTVNIASSTYDNLLGYSFGKVDNLGDKILTFEEFLMFCKRNNCGCHLEVKISAKDYAEEIVSIIKNYGMLNRCYIEPSSVSDITYFNACDSGLNLRYQIGANTADAVQSYYNTYSSMAKQIIFNIADATSVSQDYSDLCHKLGCLAKVNYTTNTNLERTEDAFAKGFDIVLSNGITIYNLNECSFD